ncbi:hypothetical protein [Tessaracoccus sp. OH4464_COT-324]|uniref:hypothetical protein n=1 Tax=Tessaracoccus sp. OH4464_COT-324 TaxID=2491059 RepID=UPI000F639B4D|nr:hypothetical protein [Tessaracoccus sp. OH4464_COT-324]RRD45689.1 hypothetical protein EII42_10575 [Tessaracoccus sp. OH4464_COT-324]
MSERTFFLKPRPPLRAFLIAAVASLGGAVLAVVSLENSWTVVAILAIVVLMAGIALFAAAIVSMSRLGVTIRLDDEGYRISGTRQVHQGKWADVTKVTQTVDAAHITIYHGDVRRTHVIFPGGPAQRKLPEVVEEILSRLAGARGAEQDLD